MRRAHSTPRNEYVASTHSSHRIKSVEGTISIKGVSHLLMANALRNDHSRNCEFTKTSTHGVPESAEHCISVGMFQPARSHGRDRSRNDRQWRHCFCRALQALGMVEGAKVPKKGS